MTMDTAIETMPKVVAKTVPRIAILGGGIGGLVCAAELNYRLGNKVEISVFDRSAYHFYQPAFLHLALGKRKLDAIRRPLSKLTSQGINFFKGEIFRVDPEQMVINAEHGDFEFDYIILALGAQLDPGSISGFKENALNLYTSQGASKLSSVLSNFTGGKITIAISSMPYKCPAAPYEMAFLLNKYFSDKQIRNHVDISIVTPESQPMPTAGPAMGKAVIDLLEKAQIEYFPNETIKSIGEHISLTKKRLKTDLTIGVPTHRCPDIAIEAKLASKNGWIAVDKYTLETGFENVFAVGDNTVIPLTNGKALPKAGVFARAQAEVVALNLAQQIAKGKIGNKKFNGKGGCFLEVGGKKAAKGQGDFFHEPDPKVTIKQPSMVNYIAKMLYEKYWLRAYI